ncbi:ABC-three component system protein [Microvirga lotononidis]|uniref:ABC-three component systems C-terminal domain-containing protein n=1 Tax=Microvirga lotononidis TaxID=864069 RepID=I4YS86_9HYPH|nr:ABC-three component system protein [Microvirga lotononidis]EIM26828.1 hypothetical protein MicloDRAFT_00033780 [Microvirga lotononidis]WQO31387.1 ABC-three component system protein [Microvirga lotononidis]
MSSNFANQARAVVQGDQAGRDVIKTTTIIQARETTQVSLWIKRLEKQITEENRDAANRFVESLKYFVDQRDDVEIVGLKAKIEASSFNISYRTAISRKEEFAKLMLRYQEFSSAQELFAYFLSIIHDVFEEKVCPKISEITYDELQQIIDEHIIDKIFSEIGEGSESLFINRNHVRGMIYWLADKCYVRWH